MIRALILAASAMALAMGVAAQSREPASPTARVTAANRAALREPSSAGYIYAVQVYPWAEGVLYRLYAAPERITDIALQPGETIVSVAAGDTVRWTVGDTTSGIGESKRVHILVKPFSAGLRTNLATPRKSSYKLFDGRGLYLLVQPGGTKLWRMKYRSNSGSFVVA